MSCFGKKQRNVTKPNTSSTFMSDISSQWLEDSKMKRSTSSLDKFTPPDFYGAADLSHAHVEDVWREVRALERHKSASSRYREIGSTMEPIIDFFTRYTPVLDTAVQSGSSVAVLVWGSLKAVLLVAQASINYFYFIDKAMTKLSDLLSISRQYEQLYAEETRVRYALSHLYDEVYLFLERIRIAVTENSWRIFLKNIQGSFGSDFNQNISQIERYTRVFNDEITLAHRKRLDTSSRNIACVVGSIYSENTSLHGRVERREADEYKALLLNWLNQVDFSEDFERNLKKRASRTGLWLLDNLFFQQWIRSSSERTNSLWLHGNPGSGKSVLSATVIEHIKCKETASIAYFYCDSVDASKRSSLNICGSILSQLVMQHSSTPTSVSQAYNIATRYGRQHIADSDNLFEVIKDVISSLPVVYIILDALDECENPAEVASCFASIARDISSLRLCIFSRDVLTIRTEFEGVPTIRLESSLIQQDINSYISTSLNQLPGKGTEAQDHAYTKISAAADGMFLFAALVVQNLSHAVDSKSVREVVASIPTELDGIYSQALEKIGSQSLHRRNLARKLLLWVCCATRPLSWKELQSALSWDDAKEMLDEDQRPFRDSVLDLCYPLIEYRPEKDTFHVVHFSVREFLCNFPRHASLSAASSRLLISLPIANQEIAQVSLAALSMGPIRHNMKVNLQLYPLVRYATENWCKHLISSSFDQDLCKRYENFAASPVTRSTWISRFLLWNRESSPLQRIVKLQKEVYEWMNQLSDNTDIGIFNAEDLADIQRALIDLDELPQSQNMESISGFERNIIVRDLARSYTMAGKIDQGIELFETALSRLRKLRGMDSVCTVWLLNSLGIFYDQKALTHQALETQLEALAIQEKHLPADHLDTTLTINELGRVARHLGEYEKAEGYHLRALQTLRKALPESDGQIVWTLNTLARSYRREGRTEEALKLHRQALEGQIKLHGKDHPHTIWTMGDIVRCLRDLSKLQPAVEMLQTVYEYRVHTLGPLNPDTLWTLNDMALLLESQGDIEKAKRLHSEALAGQVTVLGIKHSHTLWTKSALERLDFAGASN